MKKFKLIQEAAAKRKGGEAELQRLLIKPLTEPQLKAIPDDRYLAQMTRCVFNAGFHWRVITSKWPSFEEAFHGFDLGALLTKSPDEWEAYQSDARIVRNWQKIQTVFQNAVMIDELAEEHGSFGEFFCAMAYIRSSWFDEISEKRRFKVGWANVSVVYSFYWQRWFFSIR